MPRPTSIIPWTVQSTCLFAKRGFTPQPILIRTQGTDTSSQNNTWKQPRLLGEVFEDRQRCLCPFPCRYKLLQPQCNKQRLWPHVLPAPWPWYGRAKPHGSPNPQYDPKPKGDHVCQDTGSAGPLGKKVLLTPQQEQLKQQHVPESTARPHFRNVSSLLVFTGSFMFVSSTQL